MGGREALRPSLARLLKDDEVRAGRRLARHPPPSPAEGEPSPGGCQAEATGRLELILAPDRHRGAHTEIADLASALASRHP